MSCRKMVTSLPQFIHSQFAEDITLADRIVEFFHAHPFLHVDGTVYDSDCKELTGFKKSTEISAGDVLCNFPVLEEFREQLQIVMDEYLRIYPKFNNIARFGLRPFNIQYYKPGEGFLSWHCETHCGLEPPVSRVLAFMFYCQTIRKGGGTEFFHQDLISKSEKGKFVLFPPDWTFMHRGEPCKKEKMIVTGWWNFEKIQEGNGTNTN